MSRKRGRAALPAEPLDIEIEGLSHDGRGVGRVDGKTVFVRDGLPGERVMARLTLRKKNYDEATVSEVLRASDQRIEPPCAHFGVCGGCSLQHLAPEDQIGLKEKSLLEALEHIGKVRPAGVAPPLRGPTTGYRRKARLGAKWVRRHDRVFVGFRERASSFVTDIRHCAVLHDRVGPHVGALADMIDSLSIRGAVPQVEMAMGDDRCVMVFRILEAPTEEDSRTIASFCADHDWVPYVQEGGPDSIRPLEGAPVELHYSLPQQGVHFSFLPTDFTQVNLDINRAMVAQALQWLSPEPEERVLDLFCGLGNFTLPLAKRCATVVGVEGDAGLVARARRNADLNAVSNARFYTANLYDKPDDEPWARESFDAVLLDPPRSGAAEVLPLLSRMGIGRILYVSCYPGTLARDAGVLVHEYGYRLNRAGVMDMFPHTAHVESMALFVKS